MPETSVSRGKYNYNKHQKEKQNKILQYYRRSFKSQLAPVREQSRPKRTRKQYYNSSTNPIANGTGRFPKLTKTQELESKQASAQETETKQQKNLEKTENLDITKSSTQKGGEGQQQQVIMD